MTVEERLRALRIIPVVSINRAADVIPLCEALRRAGLPCAEITFRTSEGRKALRLAAAQFPDFLVGAGTVTTAVDLQQAKDAGASFAVAPGTNPRIVEQASKLALPFFPGIATPSEVEIALQLGCRTVKFFPAESLGGISLLKAIYTPYRHRGIRFIPTGGITAGNLKRYLELPAVAAVGGSWMVASSLLERQDWQTIETLAREAVRIAGENPASDPAPSGGA